MDRQDSMLRGGDDLSRRRFMEWFAGASCGVSLAGMAGDAMAVAAGPAKAKQVIALYLRGGLSHVDTFDPKPGKAEMGGVKPIATSADGIQIGDWFPQLAKQMHHVGLVRSMTSTQGVHERGSYLARTNYFQTPTITHASFGTWVYRRMGTDSPLLPGFVLINGGSGHPGSGYMESHLAPLPIVDPGEGLQNSGLPPGTSAEDLSRRIELSRNLARGFAQRTPHRTAAAYQKIREEAVGLMKSKDLEAFDIARENPRTIEAYGTHTFGQGCLLARRLVEHGVRFIEVEDTNNWDTHNDHVPQMRQMTPPVDQTIAALLSDLADRGLLDSTLVMMTTEFGRSPGLDPLTKGRGHHPTAFTWWLAGGGIKAGYVHGSSDEAGQRVADKPVNMEDFNATVAHALGIDLAAREFSPSGRPFTIAHDGKPVLELFA